MSNSILAIRFSTTGDIIKNDVIFSPNMVFQKIRKDLTIYFPPTVKITKTLLDNSVKENTNPIDIFTSRSYFLQFMAYSTNRRRFKPISLQKAVDTGVVKHNMEFFKKLFFKKENRIFIDGRAYTILSSKLNIEDSLLPKNKSLLQYIMRVNIKVIEKKKDTYLNRTKLSCKDKRANINEQWEAFFGEPFFDSGLPETRDKRAPVMYTGDNMGIADAARPKKLIPIARMVPPYANPGFQNPYQPMNYNRAPSYPIAQTRPYANPGFQNPYQPMNYNRAPSYPIAQTRPYYQNQSFPMTNPIPSAPPASPYNSKPRIMSNGIPLLRQTSTSGFGGGKKKTKRRKKKIKGTRKVNKRRR